MTAVHKRPIALHTGAAALLLLAASCGGGGSEGHGASTADASAADYVPFTFTGQVFERTAGDCAGPGTPCGRFRIAYPGITGGGTDSTRVRMNRLLVNMVTEDAMQSGEGRSFEELAAGFLGEFTRAREEFPDAASTSEWTLEVTLTPLFDAPEVLSLQLLEFMFSGGAHPNSITVLRSFDTRSGSPLRLEDMVRPESMDALIGVGERRFREVRGIGFGNDLRDAGFFAENEGGFYLTDNVAITADGLRFFYNPFDIAAYAEGPTGLLLPWDEVRKHLLPGTPAAAAADQARLR